MAVIVFKFWISRKHYRAICKWKLVKGQSCWLIIIWCRVGYVLSSHMLSKNIKVTVYETINLPIVSYVYRTWWLTLSVEHTPGVKTKRVLGKILDQWGRMWSEACKNCIMRNFKNFTPHRVLLGWSNEDGWVWQGMEIWMGQKMKYI